MSTGGGGWGGGQKFFKLFLPKFLGKLQIFGEKQQNFNDFSQNF
jgi:hypothetical protein